MFRVLAVAAAASAVLVTAADKPTISGGRYAGRNFIFCGHTGYSDVVADLRRDDPVHLQPPPAKYEHAFGSNINPGHIEEQVVCNSSDTLVASSPQTTSDHLASSINIVGHVWGNGEVGGIKGGYGYLAPMFQTQIVLPPRHFLFIFPSRWTIRVTGNELATGAVNYTPDPATAALALGKAVRPCAIWWRDDRLSKWDSAGVLSLGAKPTTMRLKERGGTYDIRLDCPGVQAGRLGTPGMFSGAVAISMNVTADN